VIDLVACGVFSLVLAGMAVLIWRAPAAELAGSVSRVGRLTWPKGPLTVELLVSRIGPVSLLSLTGCGVLVGLLAGMLGIGGAVLLIPLLIRGFLVPLRLAIGTSALVVFFSALVNSAQYAWAGQVDLVIVAALMLGSTLGVQLGAWLSHRLSVERLRRSFAALVTAVAVLVLLRVFIPQLGHAPAKAAAPAAKSG
jgi:uncharacterized membrane protein YfcA